MPNIKDHLLFDIILQWEGIISDETKTYKVHNFIDKNIKRHHYEIDDDLTENKVRSWVSKFAHFGDTMTLTDYIRVTFGHLVMDEIWDTRKQPIDNLRKAYSLFQRRGFCTKKFKSSFI